MKSIQNNFIPDITHLHILNYVTKHYIRSFTATLALLLLFAFPYANAQDKLNYTVLSENTHNNKSFTQGLFQIEETMYESSGLYGRSFLSIYNAKNNSPLNSLPLPKSVFAEGITVVNDILYVLTWREQRLLRFQVNNMQPLPPLPYREQGWGLTHNDKHFIMSDGSATLYFRNLTTFAIEKELTVKNSWRKYNNLNELEFVNGYIYSNIWQSPYILKINADTGEVVGIADLSDLVEQNSTIKNHTVLNGIAYDPTEHAFWITGKLWSKRYLVQLEEVKKNPQQSKQNNKN